MYFKLRRTCFLKAFFKILYGSIVIADKICIPSQNLLQQNQSHTLRSTLFADRQIRTYAVYTKCLKQILVNNKLDALFQCIYLFHFSSAHDQENQLYQYIIWCISLCVGDCLVCWSGSFFLTGILGSHLHRVIYTR